MQIEGKTALVTGAAGALGSATVAMLQSAGAKQVYALDINEDALSDMANETVSDIACDLTNAKQVTEVTSKLSAIDILINNAGILHSAPLVNIMNKDESRFMAAAQMWDKVIATNLSSAFYVSQSVADKMVRDRVKGTIINISSVSAGGTAGQSAYAAAKAGLEALTNVWAKELGPLGIRCAAVAPGYIDTPSTRKALPDSQIEAITEKIPLKKLGDTPHILDAIRHVIENDYINGTIIEVNGGLTV